MNTAVPGTLVDRAGLVEHLVDRPLAALDALGDELAAASPRRHLDHQADADEQREPAAVRDLRRCWRAKNAQVDDQQRRRRRGAPSTVDQLHLSRATTEEDQRGDRPSCMVTAMP